MIELPTPQAVLVAALIAIPGILALLTMIFAE